MKKIRGRVFLRKFVLFSIATLAIFQLAGAQEYQLKSLAIEKELGRKDGMAATYANLGIIENDRDNMEAACGHWAEALKLYQEVNIPDKISKYQNIMKAAGCENTPS